MTNQKGQILAGRISYDDLQNTDPLLFPECRSGEGVTIIDRVWALYSEINYGITEDNPLRVKGSTREHKQRIADTRKKGISLKENLGCVSPYQGTNPKYKYTCENGMTTYKADRINGQVENGGIWVDVVEFSATEKHTEEYNRHVYLHNCNDPLPSDPNSVDDLVKTATELIYSKDLDLSLEAVTEYVNKSAPNMPQQNRNKAIKLIVKEEEVPTKTISWDYGECNDWLEQTCVEGVEVDYCFPYHYFQDRIYVLMKQYHDTKDIQNVVQHFPNTGDSDEVVLAARTNQVNKWEEFRLVCKSLAQFMVVNDWQLPFNLEYAFPQIKDGKYKEAQDHLVKLDVDEILKKSSPVSLSKKKIQRPRFNFVDAGIPLGSVLTLSEGLFNYECIVKNEHQVEYEGKTFYLSPLTQNLLGIVRPIRGQAYWKYNNRLLSDIYEDVHA